jgi:hypothetical protein
MLNNIVGYWAYIQGLIFKGGLIFGGGGGLYLEWGEHCIQRFTVYSWKKVVFSCHRHTFLGAYRTAYTLGSHVDPMVIQTFQLLEVKFRETVQWIEI